MILYKLIITNGIFAIFFRPVYFAGMRWWYGVRSDYGYDTVSRDYIDLNYSQALFLLGVIYCPMVPLLWVLLTYIEFRLSVCSMRRWCRASLKPFETKVIQ